MESVFRVKMFESVLAHSIHIQTDVKWWKEWDTREHRFRFAQYRSVSCGSMNGGRLLHSGQSRGKKRIQRQFSSDNRPDNGNWVLDSHLLIYDTSNLTVAVRSIIGVKCSSDFGEFSAYHHWYWDNWNQLTSNSPLKQSQSHENTTEKQLQRV